MEDAVMAELSFQLKTLETLKGALDIIRFFGTVDAETIEVSEIGAALDLSDRSLNKAVRRLVTKQYIEMEGAGVYRLSEKGREAVEELAEYDQETGGGLALPDDFEFAGAEDEEVAEPLAAADMPFDIPDEIAQAAPPARPAAKPTAPPIAPPPIPKARTLSRRMVLAVPQPLVARQPTDVIVGFHDAPPDAQMTGIAQVVIRLSVVNGQPDAPDDALMSLTNDHIHETIQITPGRYDQVRIRVEAYQMGTVGGISEIGGMYVDVPVVERDGDSQMVAFGADVTLTV